VAILIRADSSTVVICDHLFIKQFKEYKLRTLFKTKLTLITVVAFPPLETVMVIHICFSFWN